MVETVWEGKQDGGIEWEHIKVEREGLAEKQRGSLQADGREAPWHPRTWENSRNSREVLQWTDSLRVTGAPPADRWKGEVTRNGAEELSHGIVGSWWFYLIMSQNRSAESLSDGVGVGRSSQPSLPPAPQVVLRVPRWAATGAVDNSELYTH